MKILFPGLLLLLSILHVPAQNASAQDSAAPSASIPDLSAQDNLLKKREATVKKLRELMDNPATTPDMKLKLAAAAFDLLDQDTAMLQADHELLTAARKALDAKPSAPASSAPPAPDAPKSHGVHPPDARVPGIPAN